MYSYAAVPAALPLTVRRLCADWKKRLRKKVLIKEVNVVCTGCFGLCSLGPVVIVYPEGSFYSKVTLADIPKL